MAELLKYMYNPVFFERLCPTLTEIIPGFKERRFINKVFDREWSDLELKQRTRKVTLALHGFLPTDFNRASQLLVAVSKLLMHKNESQQSYPLIFLPDYISLYGLAHFESSMNALEEITKLVSAEFAIRPFIMEYHNQAMEQMLCWSKHTDPFVRRLSSEGCRPRLPWAMGLPVFKKDPSTILPILENLKEDSSEYVRRSVANNLNDIAKDHPSIVLDIALKWKDRDPKTDWIIKHGCRTLLKRGSTLALELQGFNPENRSVIKRLSVAQNVKIGDYLMFDFTFQNQEQKRLRYRLEYSIDFITSTGKISKKVFKISESMVEPGATVTVKRKQSFKNLTTRKHFKGKHRMSILINGKVKAEKTFIVN